MLQNGQRFFSLVSQVPEKRTDQPRLKSFMGGTITLRGKNSTFDCIIKDYSWFGACLFLKDFVKLPDEFNLALKNKNHMTPMKCRVAWQSATSIGVEFC